MNMEIIKIYDYFKPAKVELIEIRTSCLGDVVCVMVAVV
jgi:hypothetical protein